MFTIWTTKSSANENLHNEKSSGLELMFLHNFALSTSELPSYYFTASVHVIDISYSRIIDLRSKLRNDKWVYFKGLEFRLSNCVVISKH